MSKILSDFNPMRPSRVSRRVPYADVNTAFVVHPVLNDIIPVLDIDAVKNSVRNLALTSRFDRPFHPEIGGNISQLLFENADAFTAMSIRQELVSVIARYEPRVINLQVSVFDDSERNAFYITLTFGVTFDSSYPIEISFYLNRLR